MILNFGAENDFKASVVMTTLEVGRSFVSREGNLNTVVCVCADLFYRVCV